MQYLAGKLRAVLAVGVLWRDLGPSPRSVHKGALEHNTMHCQGSIIACQFGLKQHGAHNLLRNLYSAGILLAHLKVCLVARASSFCLSSTRYFEGP